MWIKVFVDPDKLDSYTMGCPPVHEDNPQVLGSGLSYV